MNTFIDMETAKFAAQLKAGHYPFPRAQELRKQFNKCVEDYYAKALTGKPFEARGLLVTGKSRIGKSHEIDHMIRTFNESGTLMPDGRPARFVQLRLWGRNSLKDLGSSTLEALDYPASGKSKPHQIWEMVLKQARRNSVIGIHYDEAQHAFTDTGAAMNRAMLDSFKALLKEPRWPMILILSGVDGLAQHVERAGPEERRQLRHLLRPVRFQPIDFAADWEEVQSVAFSYGKKQRSILSLSQITISSNACATPAPTVGGSLSS
nr:ATP-binding protein [Marinicella sp. W31]MDC2876141.1 ATP-binding protein [Marinicella sp. W31]